MRVLWLLDVFLRLVRVHLQPWLRCVQQVDSPFAVFLAPSRETNTKNVRAFGDAHNYECPANVDHCIVVGGGTGAAP